MKQYKALCIVMCLILIMLSGTSYSFGAEGTGISSLDSIAAKYAASRLTYDVVAEYDNGSNIITRSLYISDTGANGSSITWESSDVNHITNSGRVIRPHWDEEDASVTLKATIKYGSATVTKNFEFTVLKDEKWSDPQFMTDEEFFGVWDGNKWVTESKLNYELDGLRPVEEAVKNGDYSLAGERLQSYYATRTPKTHISESSRNTLWTSALLDDFYNLQGSAYYHGEFSIGNEWGAYEASINTDNITLGSIACYSVRSWYNESSYAEIKRHSDSDANLRPKLELIVNGKKKTLYATDTAQIRAGDYKKQNYSNTDVMKVQTFGDFLGNDTYHSVLKFDFSDLQSTDEVTSAKLIIYGKAYPAFSGEKRMIVVRENTTLWSSQDSSWNSFSGVVYSYNGLPGKNNWLDNPAGSDYEYYYQNCRFYGFDTAIMAEYKITENEEIMYKTLSILNDYLHDTGNYKMVDTGTPDETGLRGGFTRTIDAKSKNEAFIGMIELIAESKTTTPDLFTAILKNIWDTTNYIASYHSVSGNWRQSEFQAMLFTATKMPEFSDSLYATDATKRCRMEDNECCLSEFGGWMNEAKDELESLLFVNTLDDGSYIEPTGGYSLGAFDGFQNFKSYMMNLGADVSSGYDERLLKNAYYTLLMYTPDGRTLQYGDEAASDDPRTTSGVYSNISKWYNDDEFEYILTYGKNGKEPGWTSKHFPDGAITLMRANWNTSSPFLFTNVRGGGQHGHADYNGVIVSAYGRTLLTDSGIFTYTETDPLRKWGKSTAAHNTVLINDTSQVRDANGGKKATGTIYDWSTNSSFDYLSQYTPQNTGFEHRRTITFIKPTLWIISDLMIPDDLTSENNYKQIWHMLPDADMNTSEDNNTIYSNYVDGANVIVAGADGATSKLETETGYYDSGYQQVQEADYSYFEKNAKGNVTFDSVVIPSNNDKTAKAKAEKLPSSANATALKVDFTLEGKDNTAYYYMSYDNEPGEFGKYSTDGEVCYIQEDQDGNRTYFMIKNGTYIKDSNGQYILKSAVVLDELAVNIYEDYIDLISGNNTDVSQMQIKSEQIVRKVTLNSKSAVCTVEGNNIMDICISDKTPDRQQYLYYEDFEQCDSIDDASGFVAGEDGNPSIPQVSSGRVKLERTGESVGREGVRIFFNENKSPLPTNRRVAIEFDIENPTDDQVIVNLTHNGSVAQQGVSLDFSAGYLSARNGNTAVQLAEGLARKNKVVVVIYGQQYDVYLNGASLAKGFSFRHTAYVNAIAQLEMFFGDTSMYGPAYIDNIKVYYDLANDWLYQTDITVPTHAISDFELPLISSECAVEWESENQSVIRIDGNTAIVNPSGVRAYDVVLNASITVNGIKYVKSYVVNVPACELPSKVGEYIYNEDFENCKSIADASGAVMGEDGNPSLPQIASGRLKLERTSESVGREGVRIFFDENKTLLPTNKKIAIEFDLETTTNEQVIISLTHNGSIAKQGVNLDFTANYLSTRDGNVAKQLSSDISAKNNVVVVVYGRKFDVYLNGIKVAENCTFRHDAVQSIAQLEMFFGDVTAVGPAYIDNIKVYEVIDRNVKKVDDDFERLESIGFSAINRHPASDVYESFGFEVTEGNSVKFASKNGFVNKDGTLNMPLFAQSDIVTITITNGNYEKSKDFEYRISGSCYIGEIDPNLSGWENNKYYAAFPAYMRTDNTADVMMAVAVYEENKLIGIKFETKTINPESGNFEENYIYDFVDIGSCINEGAIYGKAFVVTQNLKPLNKAEKQVK